MSNTDSKSLALKIYEALNLTTTSLPDGTLNVTYSVTLNAAGGKLPYSWNATGLPAGLACNATTGEISGTPTQFGCFNVTATVTDSLGNSDSQILSLYIFVVLPGQTNPPTDPDGDGLYEDLNGNGVMDFDDVVQFFKYKVWLAANECTARFDFNGNGRIDFDDIVKLFHEID